MAVGRCVWLRCSRGEDGAGRGVMTRSGLCPCRRAGVMAALMVWGRVCGVAAGGVGFGCGCGVLSGVFDCFVELVDGFGHRVVGEVAVSEDQAVIGVVGGGVVGGEVGDAQ